VWQIVNVHNRSQKILVNFRISINDMKFTSTPWNDLGSNNEVFYSCIFIYWVLISLKIWFYLFRYERMNTLFFFYSQKKFYLWIEMFHLFYKVFFLKYLIIFLPFSVYFMWFDKRGKHKSKVFICLSVSLHQLELCHLNHLTSISLLTVISNYK
jgi:hypothetical protein